MGKQKFDASSLEGLEVKTVEVLGDGYHRITFTEGTGVIAQLVPMALTVVSEKKGKKETPEPEPEDDADEDETSVEVMRQALIDSEKFTKKEVKKMDDDEVESEYNDLEETTDDDETSVEDMKEALLESGDFNKKDLKKMDDDEIKEAFDNLSSDEEETTEDEALTADDLKEADFDDLEDIVDEQKLEDIDIEDYNADDTKSVDKLRKAVAKALKIKL